MRLVVLGDLHFFQLGVWPWQLFSKRLLGQCNLWFHRRRHFQPSLWPRIAARVEELAPDVLLGSGDFTTTASPGEFAQAREAWEGLVRTAAPRLGAYVVPGNHDRYTYQAHRRRLFEDALAPWTATSWPARWSLGEGVTVLGLDPTRPNPFNASGVLGEQQRDCLAKALATLPQSECVLVLCHYPIGTPPDLPEEAEGHGLQDKEALTRVLAESGRAIVYLHGHIHWPWRWVPPNAAKVVTVNVGAPMLTSATFPLGQGIAELVIKDGGVRVHRHVMDVDGRWTVSPEE